MGIISNIFYQASRIYLKVGIPTILTYLTNWYFSTYLVLIILYYVVYGGIILCITLDYPYLPNPCMRLRSIA